MYSQSQGKGCLFCTGVSEKIQSHGRKSCPMFKWVKTKVSAYTYVDVKLQAHDEVGFAAAGFLLWKRVDNEVFICMARECKKNGTKRKTEKLDFPGGKRIRYQETALNVALRKVNEETGGHLKKFGTLEKMKYPPMVYWSQSLYALFLFELDDPRDFDLDIRCANDDIKLEWVPRDKISSSDFLTANVHTFVIDYIEDLCHPHCDVLRNLEEISDVAKEVRKHAKADFDILRILATLVASATSDKQHVHDNQTGISGLIKSLNQDQIDELKLKFEPDYLQDMLKRELSPLEHDLATKARQTLDLILTMVELEDSEDYQEKKTSALKSIKELDEKRMKYLECVDEVVDAVSLKLSTIRIDGCQKPKGPSLPITEKFFENYEAFHDQKPTEVAIVEVPATMQLEPGSDCSVVPKLPDFLRGKTPMTFLNELATKRHCSVEYDLITQQGATHKPFFKFKVTDGEYSAFGTGSNMKHAKHDAALALLTKRDDNEDLDLPLSEKKSRNRKTYVRADDFT